MKEDVSRKGAKVQSAAAFLWSFLCTFAPLRDNTLFKSWSEQNSETFCANPPAVLFLDISNVISIMSRSYPPLIQDSGFRKLIALSFEIKVKP